MICTGNRKNSMIHKNYDFWTDRKRPRLPFLAKYMADQITTAFTTLKKSEFRSRFKMTNKDRHYIHTKGIDTIRSHAVDFITTRLAPAFPKDDGKQTAMKGASRLAYFNLYRPCLVQGDLQTMEILDHIIWMVPNPYEGW